MKREKRLALLEKANRELGRELVFGQEIPEVYGCSMAFVGKGRGLQLHIMCSEPAKQKVLEKYGTHYKGFKLYFTIGGPIVFAAQTAKDEVAV